MPLLVKAAFLSIVLVTWTIRVESTPLDPLSDDFTHHAFLDQNGKYKVYWKFDDVKITFEVHVETTGYVGFGFSPNGGMPGSDIVIGWVTDNGRKRFTDRHAVHYGEPIIDETQDYRLLHGTQVDGFTILKFERKLDTCDDGYDWIISRSTARLIWAYHSEDPADGQPLPWHGRANRGSRSLYLLQEPASYVPKLEDIREVKSFEILNNDVQIPHYQDTTYMCKGFQLPKLDKKHHIAMYEPIIEAGNEALVHHFIVYQCRGSFNETLHHGHSSQCYSPNMPPEFYSCETIIMGWAIGGGPLYFPEKAGLPFGGDEELSFVMLETHYDNPEYKDTFRDSSGVRVWYTSNLREHDVNMITLGGTVTPAIVIPPKADRFTLSTYCSSECSKKGLTDSNMNETELHVFGSLLHSHLAGRAIRVRHIRDGVELPMLAQDEHYDFNYQEFVHFKEEVTVRPGDSFVVECDYETKDRETITYGGAGTYEEMCLAFFYAYPQSNFFYCTTLLLPEFLAYGVGIQEVVQEGYYGNYVIKKPEHLANISLFDYLEHMNWTDESNVAALERAYQSGLTYETCSSNRLDNGQGQQTNDTEYEDDEFPGNLYFPSVTFERRPAKDRQCDLGNPGSDNGRDVIRAGGSAIHGLKMMILLLASAVIFASQ
ncbi:DBH-like monooxygenase protein 1 homolog [Ptychodera flava]|uniref:DBH-like monooxygenase protein 1 homolog n=1 Tax=Ptychodera flava TaxID=63121 RepID=UPI00396A857B